MKEIPLSQGKIALVDDDDYERFGHQKWSAGKATKGIWYAFRTIRKSSGQRTTLHLHRAIISAVRKGQQIDHKDGDGLNCVKANLRVCNSIENQRNARKKRSNYSKTSVYKGVHWDARSRKWRARIHLDGKNIHLGLFESDSDAASAYDDAAKEYFGEFARTNF